MRFSVTFRSLSFFVPVMLASSCGSDSGPANKGAIGGVPQFAGNLSGDIASNNPAANPVGATEGDDSNVQGNSEPEAGNPINEGVDPNMGLDGTQSEENPGNNAAEEDLVGDNPIVDEDLSEEEVAEELPPGPPVTLRDAAEVSGRLIGVALATFKLNRDGYGEAATDFNFLTHENDMKWQSLERQPNVFNFANADTTIEFAEANDMQVKGHTLVWHSQLPDWVKELQTRDEVLSAMENHITTVVERYRGRIHSYDVVNEAFTDGGNSRLRGSNPGDATDAANDGTNGPDSVFRRLIGADYIDRAFQIANAADPDALLFYNDYNGEGTGSKSNAIFEMVRGMVQRGIPIDGVGLQMHVNAGGNNGRSANDIAQNIARITALGLQVHITELDATLCGNGAIEQRRQQQASRFAEIVSACTDQPLCTAITMWGVADSDSWRNSNCNGGGSEPLLFNDNYQRKPAYDGVFNALLEASTDVAP